MIGVDVLASYSAYHATRFSPWKAATPTEVDEMFLTLALLIFQPQGLPLPAPQPTQSSVAAEATAPAASPSVTPPSPATASNLPREDTGATQSVSYEPGQVSPTPVATISSSSSTSGGADPAQPSAPASFTRAPNMTALMVSVQQLRMDAWRKRKIWYGLALVNHSAAGFDAWTTNHQIADSQGRELDPLMKPFAGNPSIYVATQIGPTILDFVGKRMMYSRHSWIRNVWWVPQALGTAGSLFSGAHNLSLHAAAN